MDIHIYLHGTQDQALLRDMNAKLGLILQNQETIMATVTESLDRAEAAAKANTDAEDSIIIVLSALRADIAALKAAGTDPATAARIEALAAALEGRKNVLAAAAVANT